MKPFQLKSDQRLNSFNTYGSNEQINYLHLHQLRYVRLIPGLFCFSRNSTTKNKDERLLGDDEAATGRID